MSSVVEQW